MNVVTAWHAHEANEVEQHLAWARSFQRALHPFVASGVYVNFLGDEGEEQVRASYGVNYERLVALKNTYDPANFFHFNQNIKPVAQEAIQ
jgi:FAD/FMN-containing dehydrogenase